MHKCFLKKNYQPIKHVIDKLSRNGAFENDCRDEMDFIHSVVEDLTIKTRKWTRLYRAKASR
ncbi:MAG: hypothetical protein L6V93_15195 [Clostridiales bacterium]|nr:MAG: hypothetical protein L6V93_15195 [Clostridiales bacterium]